MNSSINHESLLPPSPITPSHHNQTADCLNFESIKFVEIEIFEQNILDEDENVSVSVCVTSLLPTCVQGKLKSKFHF